MAALLAPDAAVGVATPPELAECALPMVDDRCELWVATYDNPEFPPPGPIPGLPQEVDEDTPRAMAIGGDRVYVTGVSVGPGTGRDWATIALDVEDGERFWVARHDGEMHDSDEPFAIALAPDGARIYVVGSEIDAGPFGGISRNFGVVAYDAVSGQELWVARVGPGVFAQPRAIAVSPDGSRVFVAGGILIPGRTDVLDAVIAAFDATTGETVWEAFLENPREGSDNETAYGLAVSADGSLVHVAAVSDPNVPAPDLAASDILVAAYDARVQGTPSLQWSTSFDSGGRDNLVGRPLALGSGGVVNVLGISESDEGRRPLLLRYTADGQPILVTAFGGMERDFEVRRMMPTPDGSVVLFTGVQRGTDTVTEALEDVVGLPLPILVPGLMWVAAHDAATGERLWSVNPGVGLSGGVDLAVSPSGSHLYVGGFTTLGRRRIFHTLSLDGDDGGVRWEAMLVRGIDPVLVDEPPLMIALHPEGARLFVAGHVIRGSPNLDLEEPGSDFAVAAYEA